MASTETYADGSWCEFYDDGSGSCYSAEGYQTDSWYSDTPATTPEALEGPSQTVPVIQAIGDVIGDIFGGKHTGYAPERGGAQYYPQTYSTGGTYPTAGAYQPRQRCDGIQIGGRVSALGGGTEGGFCLSKTILILGAVGVGLFVFGQRKGRRG